jgi:pantoate--beta-alanine ligase
MIVCYLKSEIKNELKANIANKDIIGLVPTMGSLHKGHLSLIKTAVENCNQVWVSIFINPTQFNNESDLKNYPKNIKKDISLIESVSKKIKVFCPEINEMYEKGLNYNQYNFNGIDSKLEGKYRKGHFNGVATIVSKLFELFKPNQAFFGEKDFQQTQIVKRLIDLEKHKTKLIICPTVREKNGLAMSSRNNLLSQKNRENSSIIFHNLNYVKKHFKTTDFDQIISKCIKSINSYDGFKTEYFEIVDSFSLSKQKKYCENKSYRVFVSVIVDEVRLIDNILLN